VNTKVLLVDDDARILHTFARTLKLAGYSVVTAECGVEGLALYHRERPDIVLLDLKMPGMDGLAVLQAMREHDPEANVILTTGHGDKDAVIDALRAGASDFLSKPIDQVALESALRRAEERVHLKRKLRASQEALRQHNVQLEEQVKARTAELEREVEDHRRTAENLRESEEKFRALFNNVGDAILIHDLEGNFLEVNRETILRLGYSREELLQMGPRDIDASTYASLVPERMSQIEEEGRAVLETAHVTKDGRTIPIELSSRLIQYEGEPAILSVARDITERKQIEKVLRESEQRFREIYVESPIGIELYDAEGELLDVNEACLRIFGVSDVASIEGFRLFEDPHLPDEAKEKLLQGETVQYETTFDFERVKSRGLYETTRSGTIHLDVKITALGVREKHSLSGYLVQVQDITARREYTIH
jgi:PAS domain S-box-containing protein